MSGETTILNGYTNSEKGAYLGAIASLATADRTASDEEMNYIEALIESAEITEDQAALIRDAASKDISDDDMQRFLEVLKTSELTPSLSPSISLTFFLFLFLFLFYFPLLFINLLFLF